jgi:hypothetical protein
VGFNIDKLSNWRGLAGRLAAEFAVVVLGVSIALWADGWITERNDRAVETARLVGLLDNVNVSLSQLNSASRSLSGAADALRKLTALHEYDLPAAEMQELLLSGLLYGANYSPELNVYDDLKNSGELALLTNPNLRRALAKMDSRLQLIKLAQDDFAAVQQFSIDSYIIDHLDLRLVYGASLGLDDVVGDVDKILAYTSETQFQNRILLKLDLVTEVENGFSNMESALLDVQEIIKSQLETTSK